MIASNLSLDIIEPNNWSLYKQDCNQYALSEEIDTSTIRFAKQDQITFSVHSQ